jgi:hypothetical protein
MKSNLDNSANNEASEDKKRTLSSNTVQQYDCLVGLEPFSFIIATNLSVVECWRLEESHCPRRASGQQSQATVKTLPIKICQQFTRQTRYTFQGYDTRC